MTSQQLIRRTHEVIDTYREKCRVSVHEVYTETSVSIRADIFRIKSGSMESIVINDLHDIARLESELRDIKNREKLRALEWSR